MKALPRKQTPWRHGRARFNQPQIDDFYGAADGIFPMKAILDREVGTEIVLYMRDQTPFMEELRRVDPFRLLIKAGAGRNEFGPVCFMIFWVPNPRNPAEAFVTYEVYFNPHCDQQVTMWRELAAQSHWHVFLTGAGAQQRGFFEFPNTFGLDETLDTLLEACTPIPLVDFNRAKAKFMQENSLDDLMGL
jgi:hypothetical protein